MAKSKAREPSTLGPVSGDIVVTKVCHHFHIGRMVGDGDPIAAISERLLREEALALACRLITADQRVFLYGSANKNSYIEIECANDP